MPASKIDLKTKKKAGPSTEPVYWARRWSLLDPRTPPTSDLGATRVAAIFLLGPLPPPSPQLTLTPPLRSGMVLLILGMVLLADPQIYRWRASLAADVDAVRAEGEKT